VNWYWIIDSDTLGIEEYTLDVEGCVRAASVASGEEFHPRVFPDLTIDLAALLSDGADA
jgi:hypothetical protein